MIYIIIQIKDEISAIEYQNKLEYLKKDGEKRWQYDSDFWEWFKDKIVYDNQELNFVIITDKDDFKIDDSIKISKIDKISTNQSLINEILHLKGDNKIFFYPSLKSNITKSSPQKPKKSNIKPIKRGNIADFFIQKTNSLRKLDE
jgi:hypothetical protein